MNRSILRVGVVATVLIVGCDDVSMTVDTRDSAQTDNAATEVLEHDATSMQDGASSDDSRAAPEGGADVAELDSGPTDTRDSALDSTVNVPLDGSNDTMIDSGLPGLDVATDSGVPARDVTMDSGLPARDVATDSGLPVRDVMTDAMLMDAPGPMGPTQTMTFLEDMSNFPNPERGWHQHVDISPTASYAAARARGESLIRVQVNLEAFKNVDLPASYLTNFEQSLLSMRASGVKAILRFTYSHPPDPIPPGLTDPSLMQVLRHIDQLAPIWNRNKDLIAVHQAGFIGPWGEWHATELARNIDARRIIHQRLLDRTDPDRSIGFRYPSDLMLWYGGNIPFPPAEAFGTSDRARSSHFNDCFLGGGLDDVGTYAPAYGFRGLTTQQYRDYTENLSNYVALGNETCLQPESSPNFECGRSIAAMAQFHHDYGNANSYKPSTRRWMRDGCWPEMSRRLGYRYVLRSVTAPRTARIGGMIVLSVDVANVGFGKLFNPRELAVVLRAGTTTRFIPFVPDARRTMPLGGERRTIRVAVNVPADVSPGTYNLGLAMRDPSMRLQNDARYSIRFANVGVWREADGTNDLSMTIDVSR